MNNDFSCIIENTLEAYPPDLIHYPHWAHSSTHEELVRRKPEMALAVGTAFIVTSNELLFRKHKFTAEQNDELRFEAMRSHYRFYLE